jgi:2-oxoglutarate dehydrogenase E1 component
MTQQTDKNNNNLMQSNVLDTALDGENAVYLELLFERYLKDSASVSEDWQRYFSDMPIPEDFRNGATHSDMRDKFRTDKLHTGKRGRQAQAAEIDHVVLETERQQVHVLQLINSYRSLGHLVAYTNPLRGDEVKPNLPELTLQNYGLDKVDTNKLFDPGSFQMDESPTLGNIFRALRNTYTESIGVEYMHIMDTEEKRWIQSRLERCQARPKYDDEVKSKLVDHLIAAETLERYLH